jgi:hypothetical protein
LRPNFAKPRRRAPHRACAGRPESVAAVVHMVRAIAFDSFARGTIGDCRVEDTFARTSREQAALTGSPSLEPVGLATGGLRRGCRSDHVSLAFVVERLSCSSTVPGSCASPHGAGFRKTIARPWRAIRHGGRGEPAALPICIDSVEGADLGPVKAALLEEGIHALAFVPVPVDGGVVGKFMVYFDTPRRFAKDEL